MNDFRLEISATDGPARTGRIVSPRGEIRTPAFMPVGTAATVKAMLPASVRETGADILLGGYSPFASGKARWTGWGHCAGCDARPPKGWHARQGESQC